MKLSTKGFVTVAVLVCLSGLAAVGTLKVEGDSGLDSWLGAVSVVTFVLATFTFVFAMSEMEDGR